MIKDAVVNRGFDVVDLGNGTTGIQVKGGGMSWLAFILVQPGLMFLAAIIWALMFGASRGGDPVPLIGTGLIWVALAFVLRSATTENSKFSVDSEGIIVGGTRYRHENIRGVFLDNPGQEGTPIATGGFALIGGGGGVNGAMAATAVVSTALTASAVSSVAATTAQGNSDKQYRVGLEHGSEQISLARNMSLQTAENLFHHLTAKRV